MGRGGCPALLVRTARERASVCANINLSITNLRDRERVLSISRVVQPMFITTDYCG
jgi:hypothetical protein